MRISGSWMIRLKLREPTYVFQPGSSSWPFAAANEPRPLSREDRAVADAHELVLRRVVAQRRLQLDGGVEALRLDRLVAAGRDLNAVSCLSSANSSAPLTSV